MNSQQKAHAQVVVNKLSRSELEDKYLQLQEENITFKRYVKKQEDKIKRISTKLIRLVNDRKKWSTEAGTPGKRSAREVTLEETIEAQQDHIRKLQKENELVKQKLHVANQQLLTQGRRSTPYSHVQPRINSGVENRPASAGDRPRSGIRTRCPARDSVSTPQGPRYGRSLLEEAREENRNMSNIIVNLQQQLTNAERERNLLENELRLKNAAYQDDMVKFKEQINTGKRSALSENIELIRLQREIKEKTAAFQSIEARNRDLQDTHQKVHLKYDEALQEMNVLKSKLLEEEKTNLNLQNRLKSVNVEQKTAELQQMIDDLEHEVELLKEANERLINNALGSEPEQKWHHLEHKLRKQIATLEAVVHHDLKDKDSVLQKAASERAISDRMQGEQHRLHKECTHLRMENQHLHNRLRLLNSLDDVVGVEELEEALAVVHQNRHLASERKYPDFLELGTGSNKDINVLYNEIQVLHADTVQELEKTREMLLMQYKINKDYQMEVESVLNKMEKMKREYESELKHFAQLLDARAERIKKLERQLYDVAYGTKQFKIKSENEEMETKDDTFDTARLERGENILEISIMKAAFSREALHAMDDREPSTFITFAFYDYELVSTPIIKSGSPRFEFTSQYIVKVDDLLLHHLQKDSTLIELHQAFGTEYKTVCTCKIQLHQLLDKPQGKFHGSVVLTGVADGANYGVLDFWVRLRVPMDQAIRLYKERTKALGYLATNSTATKKWLETSLNLDQQDENFNQLELRIMSCNHVQARRSDVQPNIYCVYKFYDFADHDTAIIPNSNNPHFDDNQLFPVHMTVDLDTYLKSEKLLIYTFDDADPDTSSFLGKAVVDLIPLAHNKVLCAPFQLCRLNGTENGTIELSISWKFPYKAPESVMKIIESEREISEMRGQQQFIPEKLVCQPEKSKKDVPIIQKRTKLSKVFQSAPNPRSLFKPEDNTLKLVTATEDELKELSKEKDKTPVVVSPSLIVENETPRNFVVHESIKEKVSEADETESDTDSVIIMETPMAAKKSGESNEIRISVNHLSLHPESWVTKDPEIEKIFVEYTFLNTVEETPTALPKPTNSHEAISYNFSKVMHVDAQDNEAKRNHLAAMVLPHGDVEPTIRFVIVSEPTNDNKDCEELGSATVDLSDILNNRRDISDLDLAILSGTEDIGRLNISIEALSALHSILNEVHHLLEWSPQK